MPNVAISNLSTTWNAGGTTFTAIKMNVTDTASAAASLLMDLQVGGVSQLSVQKNGFVQVTPRSVAGTVSIGTSASSGLAIGTSPSWVGLSVGAQGGFRTGGSVYSWIGRDAYFGWTNLAGTHDGTDSDTRLFRDTTATLAQRNSTNAQTFRLYNTFTDASNYERGKVEWASNVLRIGTEKAGTGSARALELQTDGSTRFSVGTTNTGRIATITSYTGPGGYLWLNNAGNGKHGRIGQDISNASGLSGLNTNLWFAFEDGGNIDTVMKIGRGNSQDPFELFTVTSNVATRRAFITATGVMNSASVKTDAPAGGTSGTWKLGVAATVTPTSPNRTIEVDIGGTIYYIHAKTTND